MSRAAIPIDALQNAVAALPDNALSDLRRNALKHFADGGFPASKAENWKYTNLQALIQLSAEWLQAGAVREAVANLEDSPADAIDAHWLVIENGRVDAASVAAFAAQGVTVTMLGDHGADEDFEWPLTDFNSALLEDGIRLRVDGDAEETIGVLFVDSAKTAAAVSQSRIDIQVSPAVSARFIEYHVSVGEHAHYTNSVINLTVESGANVDYVRIQERGQKHSQTGRLSATLRKDTRLHHSGLDLGGNLVRNDLHIDIVEPGAEAVFDGLYIAGDGQHIDNHTRVDHRVGPAVSRQEYRGILNGKARCVWNGKAIVHDGADGTDAEQSNHNLLLSSNAEIDAKPELEIYAEDVKCSHGTTVGQLDERALFYLRSRGLDERHATRVLTHAFATEIVGRLPLPDLRDRVTAILEQRLGDLAAGGTL